MVVNNMKEVDISICNIEDIEYEYDTENGWDATMKLHIIDDDLINALYFKKIKKIKILYEEEEKWKEKLKKEQIKNIKKSIKKLQQELNDLESEVKENE